MKAHYLQNNPNTRGIRDDYWTEEKVSRSRKWLAKQKWIRKVKGSSYHYSITINGETFTLAYEEMVEILAAMRDCSLGNEAFISAKLKVDRMFENLPTTDY